MNDEIHMKSDESYSTHISRQSDSSFICEVMIEEVCLSSARSYSKSAFFCLGGERVSRERGSE